MFLNLKFILNFKDRNYKIEMKYLYMVFHIHQHKQYIRKCQDTKLKFYPMVFGATQVQIMLYSMTILNLVNTLVPLASVRSAKRRLSIMLFTRPTRPMGEVRV